MWSHRNPLLCTASICSMTANILQGCEMDPRELGPVVMDFYATSLERGLAARDRSDPARFVDVAHDDFVADSLGVLERIYDHFGTPLSEAARAALQAHVAANPKGKHGEHSYSLEAYGLDPDRVRARFSDYIERFGIDAS